MNKNKLIAALLISLFASPLVTPRVHAAGTVFVDPASQGPFPAGTMVTYTVRASGIDPFNGWDISLKHDPTVLDALSIDISGSLLTTIPGAQIFELTNCVDGTGSNCGITDQLGIVHSSAAASGGLTTAGASGLLFTIQYEVVRATGSTLSFLSNSVVVAAGNQVQVMFVGGTFGTPPSPDFDIAANPTTITIAAGSSGSSTIELTSIGLFSGPVFVSSSVSPVGLTSSVTPQEVFLPEAGTGAATLKVTAPEGIPSGVFTATVSATDGINVHTVDVTVLVTSNVQPVLVKTKLHWTHHLDLSRNANTQTWKAIVRNDARGPWYVQIVIEGIDSTATRGFETRSGVLLLFPGQLAEFTLTQGFSPMLDPGRKYCFTGGIVFGDSPMNLIQTSTVTKSGCFSTVD